MTYQEMFAEQAKTDGPHWFILVLTKNSDYDPSSLIPLKETVKILKIDRNKVAEGLSNLEFVGMQGNFPKFREK
jgi:hypothetical protein